MMAQSKRVLLDTNVLVGLIDARDVWHHAAVALRDALKAAQAEAVYFDCVINETISVLARRARERKGPSEFATLLDQLVSNIPESSIVWISAKTKQFYSDILALVRATSGTLNFHDALIALGSRELDIRLIATFDSDFDHIEWLKRLALPNDVEQALGSIR